MCTQLLMQMGDTHILPSLSPLAAGALVSILYAPAGLSLHADGLLLPLLLQLADRLNRAVEAAGRQEPLSVMVQVGGPDACGHSDPSTVL
jgi:hypothetical protein